MNNFNCSEFHVTGTRKDGKRFKLVYSSLYHAMSINLWNGSVYAVLDNGKRKLIKRVYN